MSKKITKNKIEIMQGQTTDYLDFTFQNMKAKDRIRLDVGDIYENKIQCKNCGWIIRSKNRHHFVTCKCGEVSVDGGSWYHKISINGKGYISHLSYFKYKHK